MPRGAGGGGHSSSGGHATASGSKAGKGGKGGKGGVPDAVKDAAKDLAEKAGEAALSAAPAPAPAPTPVVGGTEPKGLMEVKGDIAGATQMLSIEEAKVKLEGILKQESDKSTDPGTFLTNVVDSIKDVFLDMWNIVVVSDFEHDEWWSNQPGPVSGIKAETGNFRAYVFDTGQYIRYGKQDDNAWRHYGESKFSYDPFTKTQHAEFNNARPKVQKPVVPTGNLPQAATGAGGILGGGLGKLSGLNSRPQVQKPVVPTAGPVGNLPQPATDHGGIFGGLGRGRLRG